MPEASPACSCGELLAVRAFVRGDRTALAIPDDEPEVPATTGGQGAGPQSEAVAALGDLQPARSGQRLDLAGLGVPTVLAAWTRRRARTVPGMTGRGARYRGYGVAGPVSDTAPRG
ncbi:hypothetical protein GCM10027075_22850 [Streptomyces heilongjiangensis]